MNKQELQAFTNEIKDLFDAGENHPVACNCCACRARRGEYSGVNNPNYGKHSIAGVNHYNYKDGRSFEKCYCIDCGKEIGWRAWYYGSRKCGSCVKKGRTLTQEHKEKLLQSLIPFTKGHKTNVGRLPWNNGIKYSWSEEARLRNANSPYYFKTGSAHPNWRGGTASVNQLIRASDKFARWRTEVFQRDKYHCVVCSSSHKLEAHHIVHLNVLIQKYNIGSLREAYDCQELWDIDNGETRCYQCHKLTKYGQQKN